MKHYEKCPLCSSEKISKQFSCTDNFLSKEVFNLAACTECGFEFTQDCPKENEIGKYYESADYISHSNISKSFSDKVYQFVRGLMLRRKRNLIRKITGMKTGSILDIGSGTGHFAVTLKKAGWQVKGIEINEKARAFSMAGFGLDVIDPEGISSLKSESFDCITLWHVLEHFHDPFKYAEEIRRLLKPDGVCFIAIPNSSSYDAKHYKQFWAAYDMPRHLWHFNPATFRIFSEKSGFALKKTISLPLDVFYIAALSEKYKGSGWPFMAGMITAKWFAFLSLFKKERSSSLIYILKKRN